MEKAINPNFEKHTFVLAASRFLERISYYGIRAVLALYMMGEAMNLPREEASIIYGRFAAYILIGQVIGALIGDLFIGNRRAMIIGGFIQAAGCFCLCIPGMTGLYAGLILIVLGSGLYSSNLLSEFGKQFISRPKLFDTGFTALYLVVSMGAFVAPLLAGHIGWYATFITCGMLMLAATGLTIVAGSTPDVSLTVRKVPKNQGITRVLTAIFLSCLFWTLYDITNQSVFRLESIVTGIRTPINPFRTDMIISVAVGAVFAFYWYRVYFRSGIKLAIGFMLAGIASGLLLLIPDVDGQSWYPVYVFALILIATAEIHIGPVIYSVIAQNADPKYLATWMSLMQIPSRIMGYFMGFLSMGILIYPRIPLTIGLILMTATGLLLLFYASSASKKPERDMLDQEQEMPGE